MKESTSPRTQLDNGYQIPIILFFLVISAFIILQLLHRINNMFGENYLIYGAALIIYGVIVFRFMSVKKVSFDSENFYIKSLFNSSEISIPLSRITKLKKGFINLRQTDMFLIRYTNYDSKESLVKFIRHRDHISILRFRELIKKNEHKVDVLRGVVENKF